MIEQFPWGNPIKLDDPTTLPTGNADTAIWSPDGTLLVVGNVATPGLSRLTLYKRDGDTLVQLPYPMDLPTGGVTGGNWSPDGRYLALTVQSTENVFIYERIGDELDKLVPPSELPLAETYSTTWSPDGTKLLVGYNPVDGECLNLYNIIDDAFIKIPFTEQPPAVCFDGSFTADGKFFSIAHNDSPYFTTYEVDGNTFTKLPSTSILPTGHARKASWSPSGEFLAIAHFNSPYFSTYLRRGKTLVKLANPIDLPAGNCISVDWNGDSNYLAVGSNTAPYLLVYERSGLTFTKLPDLSTPPTGAVLGVSWINDGQYLAAAHSNSPFVSVYKTTLSLPVPTEVDPEPYDKYIEAARSEKVVIAHVEGVTRLFNFLPDGDNFSKTTPHFVVGVRKGTGEVLNPVFSLEELTGDTKFYYEPSASKLYLFNFDNTTDEIIVTYRFFFSNAPIILPWDLQDSSYRVDYEARVSSNPLFKSQMAQNKRGISLIGSGTLSLINQDNALSGVYDTIIWDNNSVKIYSYHRSLLPSQAKLIFTGIISGKSFSLNKVDFSVKDSIYALDTKIPLEQYGSLTREADSLYFKRQVYGRVDNLLAQSIDQVGDGYTLTGTISGNFKDTVVTGTGTYFTWEVSPGDELIFPDFTLNVEDVINDTLLRVSALEGTFKGLEAKIIPEIHFSNKNRTFQIAGHALKKWTTKITKIVSRNRLEVESTDGFHAGDNVTVGFEVKKVRRVSGTTLVLQTNCNFDHSIGETISKTEVTNVRYGDKQIPIRDSNITILNDSVDGARIQLSYSAEYDAAKEKTLNQMFRFVNGRSKVWLGSPTFIDITCVASNKTGSGPIDYSLMGKWFSVRDEAGNEVAFWFKDQVAENQTKVAKPQSITTIQNTDGGKVKSIELESRAYSATEIASIVAGAIAANVSCWQHGQLTNVIKLESKDTIDIAIGNMGTSGFSQNKTLQGLRDNSELNLTKIFKTRDYIKSLDQDSYNYMEILSVSEKSLTLRGTYSSSSKLENLNYKNVDYIQDDTPVYVNCFGKTKDGLASGEFIETAPEAVLDILNQVGLSDRIDHESFVASKERSPYQLSLAVPLDYRATTLPAAKDIINLLNQSTLGSLHITNSLDLGYDILDAHVDFTNLKRITDADIISWSVSDDAFDISSSVITNYRHLDYDPKLGDRNSKQTSYTSTFAKNYTRSTNTSENDIYLYNETDAKEMTERDQFINDLSTSIIKLKGSMSLARHQIGDRVIVDLHGLYNSYGSTDNKMRIGVISSISNNGEKVDMDILDLGALFSRASRIDDDSAPNYSTATDFERLTQSFITEDNGIVDDDEGTSGSNLIS